MPTPKITPRRTTPSTTPEPEPGLATAADQAAMAGPPEGVEPGTSGALAEAADSPTPPPAEPTYTPTPAEPPAGLQEATTGPVRLARYLAAYHPQAAPVGPGGDAEDPCDTAIRLLTLLSAQGTAVTRCQTEASCNLPHGHAGEHGWVHVEPQRNLIH